MPKKIVIVRHGQTVYNVKDIMQGLLAIPLDRIGIKQAERVAEKLKWEIFDVFFSSDLKRAMQTAETIAKKIKQSVIPITNLRERGLGSLEGKHRDEVMYLLQIDEDLPPHHIWNFNENFKHLKLAIEKKSDLHTRVNKFVEDLKKQFKNKNVLIVSHGGTIRVILHQLGFTDEEYLKKLPIYNTSIIRLKKNKKGYDLEIETDHVEKIIPSKQRS